MHQKITLLTYVGNERSRWLKKYMSDNSFDRRPT